VPVKSGNRVYLKIMNTSGYPWKSHFEMVVECYKQKKKIPIDRDIADRECWEVDFEFFDCKESGKHKASFGIMGVGKENGEQTKYTSYKTKFTADVKEARKPQKFLVLKIRQTPEMIHQRMRDLDNLLV
jgi:hypothetical protein